MFSSCFEKKLVLEMSAFSLVMIKLFDLELVKPYICISLLHQGLKLTGQQLFKVLILRENPFFNGVSVEKTLN